MNSSPITSPQTQLKATQLNATQLSTALLGLSLLLSGCAPREAINNLEAQSAIVIDERVLVLSDVNLIDGTGAGLVRDHTIVIVDGRIREVGPVGTVDIPTDATMLDLSDRTVIPGIVGTHDPTDMSEAPVLDQTAARLYLASGMTTIQVIARHAPDLEHDFDLGGAIERGEARGPRIFTTRRSEPMLQAETTDDVAGPDSDRHLLQGLDNQRNFELLLEAGLEPGEAIAIMTRDGARALGIDDQIGTIGAGKRADLVLLRGEPETLRDVVLVFKDGKGYDPERLQARPEDVGSADVP